VNRRGVLGLSVGGLAAACAPTLQRAGVPPLAFEGARFELGDKPAYVAFDGARLGLTVWPAVGGEPWAVIVGLHGMNDYAEAFTLAAPIWAAAGVTTYAYDQRGFGRSPGRGLWADHDLLREDLRVAVRLARANHPGAVVAVAGESMGGAVAISAFASAPPPEADRLVLFAPAVWGWSFQPWLYRTTLWLGAHTLPSRSVTPPGWAVRDIIASDNIEHLRRMGRDRNLLFRTRIDAIYGLVRLMHEGQDGIGRMKGPPAFFAYGANDKIIPEEAAFAAAAKLRPGDRSAYYPRGYHMLTRDLAREAVIGDVLAFVRDPAALLPSGAPPIPTAPPGRAAPGVVTTAR
jgi:acylglycerol lipase